MATTLRKEAHDLAETVTVESRKFDGRLHRSWQARLFRKEGQLVVLDGVFSAEVDHRLLGKIDAGTRSFEYYWMDRWYSVFRFQEPCGALKYFYGNINAPPTFDGRTLTFTDLDIDVRVMPDFSYTILDLDEFEENAQRYAYPTDVRDGAQRGLDALVRLIETRQFPFDHTSL